MGVSASDANSLNPWVWQAWASQQNPEQNGWQYYPTFTGKTEDWINVFPGGAMGERIKNLLQAANLWNSDWNDIQTVGNIYSENGYEPLSLVKYKSINTNRGTDQITENVDPLSLNFSKLTGYQIRDARSINNLRLMGLWNPQNRMIAGLVYRGWNDSLHKNDYVEILSTFLMAYSLGASLAGSSASIASTLGQSIVSADFAAQYPLVTEAIGKTALATAYSGGDIESAVKNTVIGYVGGAAGSAVGAQVSSISGLDLLGKIAANATNSLIRGNDPKLSVAQTLLNYGAALNNQNSNTVDVSTNQGDSMLSMFDDSEITLDGTILFPDIPFVSIPDIQIDTSLPDTNSLTDNTMPSDMDPFFNDIYQPDTYQNGSANDVQNLSTDLAPYVYEIPNTVDLFPSAIPVQADSSLFSGGNLIGQITSAASQALQLFTVANGLKTVIDRTARVVTQNGTVQTVAADGLIYTRMPNGSISKSLPKPGVATATVDNGLVVNKGDGTFIKIGADGQVTNGVYPSGSMSVIDKLTAGYVTGDYKPLVYAGAAGIALLFLLRKK